MTAASFDADYELDHRYTRESGRVYLTGVQALVRLPLMQKWRDEAAGLNTEGFISGYRGSPLGTYDMALWQAKSLLDANGIHFEPGVNEDLAATSIWGTQQAVLQPGPRVEGVFSIWYGKGPGVDRSLDPIKHANYMGTAERGGVLALCGDDPGAKSSSIAHQSEHAFVHAGVPILNPANVQDYVDLGLMGFALSRYSGCWVAFKCLTDTVDSAASVIVGPDRVRTVVPDFAFPEADHHVTMNNTLVKIEEQLYQVKLPAAQAFVRANRLDRVVLDSPNRRLGIVTTGKAYLDVRQALEELGLDEARAADLGITLYKVAMSWPLEPEGAREFAHGLEDLLVVEEKRPLMEEQLARILYNETDRPTLLGKRDERGAPLLPSEGELSPAIIAEALRGWLERKLGENARALRPRFDVSPVLPPAQLQRLPSFCSGCPHNSSTVVPEGSIALGGIGCHGMAVFFPERRTFGATQMGGEGANWIGQARYTSLPHVFQNLGDGTYFHSGLLAVRACVAAGVNITYKVLVNGAVAMTGGQPIEGEPMDGEITCPEIAHQLTAEGVKKIVVASNEPEKYAKGIFPAGVEVRHRDDLIAVQKQLRETPGVTALVYDQTCAAEARRLRRTGDFPDPDRRIVINEAVCEGCGDCSVQSNCISIEPVETEFGRKRRINQSSCNKDYSCVNGYCPSFVSVEGGQLRKAAPKQVEAGGVFEALPTPAEPALETPFNVLLAGIGGTGVVTVGAILSMAAHLEGKGVSELDVTGLSQKNGPVSSHVRVAASPDDIFATRIGLGGADVVLGCDLVTATNYEHLPKMGTQTTLVANGHITPTAEFATNADLDLSTDAMTSAAREACGDGGVHIVDATSLATALMGDAVYTNMFLLGIAVQLGRIPVRLPALERAITLNGRAVDANQRALSWGRLWAHDREAVEQAARPLLRDGQVDGLATTLDGIVEKRVTELTAYQNARLAKRYRKFVERVAARERSVAGDQDALARAVARYYFKLLAIKDEYEVARLYTDGTFEEQIAQQFEGDYEWKLHLAADHFLFFAPGLAPRDAETGRAKKLSIPAKYMLPVFRLTRKLRFLRGTPFNPFGYRAHRRLERQLIKDYEAQVAELLDGLTPDNLETAVAIASLPEYVRGYDMVKERHLEEAREKLRDLEDSFHRRTNA